MFHVVVLICFVPVELYTLLSGTKIVVKNLANNLTKNLVKNLTQKLINNLATNLVPNIKDTSGS